MIKGSILPACVIVKMLRVKDNDILKSAKLLITYKKPSVIKDWLFNKTIEFRGQCKDRGHGLKTLVNQESYKQLNFLSKIESNKIPISALAWKFSIPFLQEKFWTNWENIFFLNPSEKRAHTKLTVKSRETGNHKILQIKLNWSRSC